MNSGTFHLASQEYSYHPQEKALRQTVHFAQLPEMVDGEEVVIVHVPPDAGRKHWSGTGSYPIITPYRNMIYLGTTGYMPASYGGHEGAFGHWIDDGLGDFSETKYHPPEVNASVLFAAPSRLGGGMCVVLGTLGLAFSQVSVGLQPAESNRLVMFTSQLPDILPPEPVSTPAGYYPPPDFTIVEEHSNVCHGVGSRWVFELEHLLTIIYPGSQTLFLTDNLTTGTGTDIEKYVGQGATTEYPNASYLPLPGLFEVLWFGEKHI